MKQQTEPVVPHASPETRAFPQERPAIQTDFESSLLRLLHQIAQLGLFRSLVQLFRKVSAWRDHSIPVENIGSQDCQPSSPNRPVRRAKKRLSRLARLLFAIVPSRFQHALGYLPAESMGQRVIPEEIQKTLVKPSGKGSKRKQDDVALEEHQSWVEVLQGDLPEEDETEDPTYEPTQSETDSEEYRSENDTETDLEFEEQDGVLALKESPNDQATLPGENVLAAASSKDGGDAEEQQAAASSGSGGSTQESHLVAVGGSSDGQEQWVEVTG